MALLQLLVRRLKLRLKPFLCNLHLYDDWGYIYCIITADLISKKGVGNGITLLILTGIVAALFSQFSSV